MPLTEERMIWVDIENFGLRVKKDLLLEVGFMITDLDLNVIDLRSVLIWDEDFHYKRYLEATIFDRDKYVLNMHSENNLFEDARSSGVSFAEAQQYILEWLQAHGVGHNGPTEPICGSSVQFDRERLTYFMPKVMSLFSYRNIDISTLKELATGYNPSIALTGGGRGIHRVLPDLEDTIEEFHHYLDHFLEVSRRG